MKNHIWLLLQEQTGIDCPFSPLHLKLLPKSNHSSCCKRISTLDPTPAALPAHAQRKNVTCLLDSQKESLGQAWCGTVHMQCSEMARLTTAVER